MKNKTVYNTAVIGGDARQLIAAARLISAGYGVKLYGFGENTDNTPNSQVDSMCCSSCNTPPHELLQSTSGGMLFDCGEICRSAGEAISGCDAVILPLPFSKDGVHISMPLSSDESLTLEQLLDIMKNNGVSLLCGGKLSCEFRMMCSSRGIEFADYYEKEEFAVANAVPTAEGAIEIAMRELPITLDGSSALIIGYGRIGRALSKKLHALGVNVTVSARKPSDIAWIKAEGYAPWQTSELCGLFENSSFDSVFNTVPHTVLGKDELEKIKPGTLIVDLASNPGGVDNASAEKLSHSVIRALSLPGKAAPVTSGYIIADTVLSCINDRFCGR